MRGSFSKGGLRSAHPIAAGGGGGNITHGDSVTTNSFGGGAGTNTGLILYDDFSGGTLNADVPLNAAATIGQWGPINDHGKCKYSNAFSRGVHSRISFHDFPNRGGGANNGAVNLCTETQVNNGDVLLMDWWLRIAAYSGDNFKIVRLYGNPYPSIESNWVYGFDAGPPPDNNLQDVPADPAFEFGAESHGSSPNQDCEDNENTWRHYRRIMRVFSNPANDRVLAWVDGVQVQNETGNQRPGGSSNTYESIRLGYYQHDPFCNVYTSCAYISKSEKCVIWTNAATIGASTIYETQAHTSWADGSITYLANKGMLSTGTNYEHIILTGFTSFASRAITVN